MFIDFLIYNFQHLDQQHQRATVFNYIKRPVRSKRVLIYNIPTFIIIAFMYKNPSFYDMLKTIFFTKLQTLNVIH